MRACERTCVFKCLCVYCVLWLSIDSKCSSFFSSVVLMRSCISMRWFPRSSVVCLLKLEKLSYFFPCCCLSISIQSKVSISRVDHEEKKALTYGHRIQSFISKFTYVIDPRFYWKLWRCTKNLDVSASEFFFSNSLHCVKPSAIFWT